LLKIKKKSHLVYCSSGAIFLVNPNSFFLRIEAFSLNIRTSSVR
jgi:hypothetical protein